MLRSYIPLDSRGHVTCRPNAARQCGSGQGLIDITDSAKIPKQVGGRTLDGGSAQQLSDNGLMVLGVYLTCIRLGMMPSSRSFFVVCVFFEISLRFDP